MTTRNLAVTLTFQSVKPYDHPDLWFSPTFRRWVFSGETAKQNPYTTTNAMAERLGLTPNPQAVPALWECWFRAPANAYEYAALIMEHNQTAAFHEAQQRSSDPVMMVRVCSLPPMKKNQAWDHYVEDVLAYFGADVWPMSKTIFFKDQLRIACSYGYAGQAAQVAAIATK